MVKLRPQVRISSQIALAQCADFQCAESTPNMVKAVCRDVVAVLCIPIPNILVGTGPMDNGLSQSRFLNTTPQPIAPLFTMVVSASQASDTSSPINDRCAAPLYSLNRILSVC